MDVLNFFWMMDVLNFSLWMMDVLNFLLNFLLNFFFG